MPSDQRIGHWGHSLQAYLLAGQSVARWLAVLGRAADQLWPFLEANRRLREAAGSGPAAAVPFYVDVLAAFVAVPDRTDTVWKASIADAPSSRVAAADAFGQVSTLRPVDSFESGRETAVPARPIERPGPHPAAPQVARDRASPILSSIPAGQSQLAHPMLQQLAGQSWVETLPVRKCSGPVYASAPPPTAAGSGPPSMPIAQTALATLVDLLEQQLSEKSWSSYHTIGLTQTQGSHGAALHNQDGGDHPAATIAPAGELVSTLIRRGYAQPVQNTLIDPTLLAYLVSQEFGTQRKTDSQQKAVAGGPRRPVVSQAARPVQQHDHDAAPNTMPKPQVDDRVGTGQVSLLTSPAAPASAWGLMPAGKLLQDLVSAWSTPTQSSDPAPAPEVVPPAGQASSEEIPAGSPAVYNTFNLTVHAVDGLAAGGPGDEQELASRIARILADQARRYGIDVY